MTRYAASALAAAALVGAPSLAHAQTAPTAAASAAPTNDDVASLRRDMEAMKQEYEARISALEARIAEQDAAQSAANAAQASTAAPADQSAAPADASAPVVVAQSDQTYAPPAPAATSGPTSQNLYNPGIAVALNGFFTAARHDTGDNERIAGFAAGDDIGHPQRGFSLGESEVSFAANIDPTLAGFFDFSIDNSNNVSLEEAYIRTTALPGGFTIKAGRFLSGIGYINERHAHDWNFSDASLPYRAFLNNQLGDDGVQVRWIAPTDQFLEFGAEAFRGDVYPAAGAADNGVGAYSAFVHTGSDINASSSYLAALSYLHTRAVDRADASGDLFTGDTNLGIASLIYKWAPNGNPLVNNLTVAGEYFYGRDNGSFNGVNINQSHQGWYVQGVYQFMPQWSVGLRASGLSSDSVSNLLAGTEIDDLGHNPLELTALLEYDTSEFGRIRMQYSHDESSTTDNDILLMQYTVIYGPHGAHRY
ncbi:MAG: outer membrane beta-barrel protein [Terricaulis sp.]